MMTGWDRHTLQAPAAGSHAANPRLSRRIRRGRSSWLGEADVLAELTCPGFAHSDYSCRLPLQLAQPGSPAGIRRQGIGVNALKPQPVDDGRAFY